jgi:hypothetical protein
MIDVESHERAVELAAYRLLRARPGRKAASSPAFRRLSMSNSRERSAWTAAHELCYMY